METQLKRFFNFLENDKKLSSNTLQSYKRDLKQFRDFIIAKGIQYNKVKEADMEEYVEFCVEEGKKASSISRSLASIRAFYQYAIKINKVKEDPTKKVKAPKIAKRVPTILTSEEIELLLEQPDVEELKGMRDKAMLEFAYATGMKVTELINLNMESVDIENGYVKCTAGSKIREIPLGRLALTAVTEYTTKARSVLVKSKEEESLFINLNGSRLTRQGFWKIIKYYKDQANIEKEITPHVLRHSFATHLLQNGADIKSIQTMLGHTDVSSTQVYMQFQTGGIKDVYEKNHPRA